MTVRKTGFKAVQAIFKRPLYVSVAVGTLMHVFSGLGDYITFAYSPVTNWIDSIHSDPFYSFYRFSVPYLIAGLVSYASLHINRQPLNSPTIPSPIQPGPQRRRLDHIARQLSNMIDQLDNTFSQYNPKTFDVATHEQRMFSTLLSSNSNPPYHGPTHLFHAKWSKTTLSGHVYFMDGREVFRNMRPVTIPVSDNHYAIFSGSQEVIVENWEDQSDDLSAFQQRFHPAVRRIVGTIERYVTYRSGDVAIIAFYRGRKLDKHDAIALKGLTTFTQSLHRIAMENQETEHAFRYLVDTLSRASEVNDEDTGAHIRRINEYARELAGALDADSAFIETIHYSAQMHDVGKIHVHPDILRKPGVLTVAEYEEMKKHCTYGAHILGNSPRLEMAREIAQHHHEKLNGRGYPAGLRGEAIPLSARIVALIDVYDALRQPRVYKPALSHHEAIKIITMGDDRTCPDDFDPAVLKAFLRIESKLDAIYNNNPD